MKTEHTLRRLAFGACVATLALAAGCAAPTDDEGTDDSMQTSEELRDGTCHVRGQKGKHYSFAGGKYRVCWVQLVGPGPAAQSVYALENRSGARRDLKIAVSHWPDTHCYGLDDGEVRVIKLDDLPIVGAPQTVKLC